MTVQELREALDDYSDDDQAPVGLVIQDLEYVYDALEQWCEISETFGRGFHPEVDRFLSSAADCL